MKNIRYAFKDSNSIWGSFFKHRNLIFQMAKRDIASRYQGSLLGIFWSFLNPLLMLIIYTFVFSVVFKARWGDVSQPESKVDFAIILFSGMLVFNFFAEIIGRAPGLIVSNPNYVKKVVFPVEILVYQVVTSALFNLFISLTVLIFVQFVLKHTFFWTVTLFPIVLLPLVFIALGIGWFFSSLAVYLRDIAQVTTLLTTILMFTSAVFFPISALPEAYQPLLMLNPLAVLITESRNVLVYGVLPNWLSLFVILIFGICTAYLGYTWFQKSRKGFADVL